MVDGADNLPPNPVAILSLTRVWRSEQFQQRPIPSHMLLTWYEAVMHEAPLGRDFLLVALLTGMRWREVSSLRW